MSSLNVGGIHAPSKVAPDMVPNPYPEMRPGSSFMNLLLAADWVASQLALEGWSHSERLELVEAHVALVRQMRAEVSHLSRVKLSVSQDWVDRVRAMSAKLGTREE